MPETSELTQLREMLLAKSIRFGDFTLVSGQKSDVYVDSKLTTYTAAAMPLVGRAMLRIFEERGWSPTAVGGLTLGADPIAFAIARESLESSKPIDSFVVRKEPKKHGMQRFIEGLDSAKGLDVVIIDDVCTTGGSTVQAIEKAIASDMHILGAICLVDREMGATEALKSQFGLDLAHVFTLSDLRPKS